MFDFIFTEQSAMIFITAVIFTLVGYVWGVRAVVTKAVTHTVDSLISEGYLKTRGSGETLEIVKWRDWDNDKTN